MNTWHIHIEGQVQGVGFRPFVYALATQYGLKGWVNNTVNGVHIQFNSDDALAKQFKDAIYERTPILSKITSINLNTIPHQNFDTFKIIHSDKDGDPRLLLTPDFGLCNECKEELYESENRRFGYPFITCINCGPRFSIMNCLPYDRENTEMDRFQMCSDCFSEYENPLDRRYYSQTNSCAVCGIEMILYDNEQQIVVTDTEIIDHIVNLWSTGKIVAIKGIGGYLLTCDASNTATIQKLRDRKHRPSKPFALMIPDIAYLRNSPIEGEEIRALKSPISPIVLVKKEKVPHISDEVAPGLLQAGVMLPYTPLYELLMNGFGRAIVATSGNMHNAPIVYKDEDALNQLSEIADFILTNNRDIVVQQDDSVIQFSTFKNQKIIIRRSRGIAPTYIHADLKLIDQNVLATGAMLKSTFSLLHHGSTYISQYLGDLEHFDTQQTFQDTINHFLTIFKAQPEAVLCDKHPLYPSTQYGEQLVRHWDVELYHFQHHIAHFGAILGEHNLIDTDHSVLGVIWDGTGLGDDGHIWGGEFFIYKKYEFVRCGHFDYFDFILQDKMPREPRISALTTCWGVIEAEPYLREKFNPVEWQVYTKLLKKENALQTSSVGRIFDAVASLLGLMDVQTFEGEAAMRLEALALTYFKTHGVDFASCYFEQEVNVESIPTRELITGIIRDLNHGERADFIAAKFHYSLVHLIQKAAYNLKIRHVAFSGGVFQNSLLIDLLQHHLIPEFQLYFHVQLSANDENISFGQLICYHIDKHKESLKTISGD